MYLLYYKSRKYFQGGPVELKCFGYWFFQMSMLAIRTVAIHSCVEHILCNTYVLFFFLAIFTFDHKDHT